MFDKLEAVIGRYEMLTEKLADPSIYDRQKEFKEISSERSSIEDVVITYREYKKLQENLDGAKEMLRNEKDEDLREMAKAELSEIEAVIPEIEERLKLLLLPRDPLDERNVVMEMRAGAGGDEASIFVSDMFRMYQNYFRQLGYKIEIDYRHVL
jgi:peptide chain release factor 1